MSDSKLQEHINKEVDDTLKTHEKHLAIANREMGVLKTDVAWIKSKLEKVDTRTWWILGSVVLGIFINILMAVTK